MSDEAIEDFEDELDEPGTDDDFDPRADGPFDFDEVDLDADDVERVTFGPLIITPFDGLGLQLHGDPATGTVRALLAAYGESGLELALFAAPRTDGLAEELIDLVRNEIGAVAAFRLVDVVPALPKTRSGKILRKTLRGIAAGRDEPVPSTIEDASVLDALRPILSGR